MTKLDQLIEAAFQSEGKQEQVNKVYLSLLNTQLYLPTQKNLELAELEDEPFIPLYTQQDENFFLPVFDTKDRLEIWAGEHFDQMAYVELKGWDIVRGIGDKVYLCLNFGTPFYKEFSPDEVKRLKMIIQRLSPSDESNMH
jgi:hypothetical protein